MCDKKLEVDYELDLWTVHENFAIFVQWNFGLEKN